MKTIDDRTMRSMTQTLKKALDPYNRLQETINEVLNPFREKMQGLLESLRPFQALNALSNAQYIEWHSLDKRLIATLINSKNINNTLYKREQKTAYSSTNNIINACKSHTLMRPHKRLFSQAISAFDEGRTDLAVIGVIAVIDGIVADMIINSTTSLQKNIEIFLENMEKDEWKDIEGINDFILLYTYKATAASFAGYSDFKGDEPTCLNRNWIMHGRSKRRKTKLDCIKLIRFLYGTLLISDLTS